MKWTRIVDSVAGVDRFISEPPQFKKLVDVDGRAHYFVREKISAMYEIMSIRRAGVYYDEEPLPRPVPWTIFVVDGESVRVKIHIENALEWLMSTDE